MPPSTRSVTPTPLVLTPAVTPPHQGPVAGFANGHPSSGHGNQEELDLSGELPSRSYLDTTNDGFHTPVGANSISPAHSPAHSKAPLTEASVGEYQSDQAELEALQNRLLIESKIKDGAENLLQVFQLGAEKEGLRSQIIAELAAANREIESLERRISDLQGSLNGRPAPLSDIEDSYSDEDSRAALAGTKEALRSLSDAGRPSTSTGSSLARQDQKIDVLNAIVQTVQRNERVKWEIPDELLVETLLPCLADHESTLVRAATYRALRHLCCEPADATRLLDQGLEIFLIKTFARNPAAMERERVEALLLARSWLLFPNKPIPIPPGIVRAMISLCENTDEKLRFLALETLAELALLDIHLLSKAEGLRTVLQAFVDGPYDISPHLAMALIPIMDMPETRQVLRPGLDVEVTIGAFINLGNRSSSSSYDEKLRTCANIVGSYMKTWTGLLYLCLNDKQAIKAFLGAIASPSAAVREIVLDTLFDVFRIDYSEHASSKRNTIRKSKDAVRARARSDSASRTGKPLDEGRTRLNLVEHYLGLVLVILVEAGLFDMLVAVGEREMDFHSKAAVLVGELLALSTRVLPVKYGTQWQTLPRVFNMAAHFDNAKDRLQSTSLLENIDKYNRQQTRQQKVLQAIQNTRARANSLEDPLSRGQRHVENSKIRMGMQIDDLAWKNLLLESQVLLTKEYQKWNYEAILEAVEGPLLNPARLNEAIKGTKFLRRVITFFHPFERRYSDLENSPFNLRWTRLACSLLTTLTSTSDGIAFLAQDRLLRQIAECLSQLDPNSVSAISEPIFGERRFAATVSSGYFAMLGTLSKNSEGLKLMEKAKIFTLLYHLSDLRGREDIITAAISNLSYQIDGHPRVVLSKTLNSPYKHIRLFTTRHLGTLLRDTLPGQEWLIKLLVTQLYDTSADVREVAVTILNDVCQSNEVLESVVAVRPSLDHLGAIGAPLLFRFLSTSVGVRYLHEIEFIEREMEHWFNDFNDLYVVQLELDLARVMRVGVEELDSKSTPRATFDGVAPLHFYGELVKTAEGRMILEAKGHFGQFVDVIRTHGMESSDLEVIAKLKSVLWAVGHIGSTAGGVEFLEHEGIALDIIRIASTSKVLSIRGTCFFVLGLIASSIEGAVLLESCNWNVAYTPVGTPTGYCLPAELNTLIYLQPWVAKRLSQLPFDELPPPVPHVDKEIITAIANLSNNLLTHTASKTLARIKQKHPAIFKSEGLYYRALHLLNTCRYRSTVRSYILEQFNVPLDMSSVHAILEAGQQIKRLPRPVVQEAPPPVDSAAVGKIEDNASPADVRVSRRLTTIDPMYRLDMDSDSDSTESEDDDNEATAPKEVMEPLLVVRGFLAAT